MGCVQRPARLPAPRGSQAGMSPSGDTRLSEVPQHGPPLGGCPPAPELGRQERPAWQEGGQPPFIGGGGEGVVSLTTRTPQHWCHRVSHRHFPCVLEPGDATGHAGRREGVRKAAVLCAGTTPRGSRCLSGQRSPILRMCTSGRVSPGTDFSLPSSSCCPSSRSPGPAGGEQSPLGPRERRTLPASPAWRSSPGFPPAWCHVDKAGPIPPGSGPGGAVAPASGAHHQAEPAGQWAVAPVGVCPRAGRAVVRIQQTSPRAGGESHHLASAIGVLSHPKA